MQDAIQKIIKRYTLQVFTGDEPRKHEYHITGLGLELAAADIVEYFDKEEKYGDGLVQ